MPASMVAFPCLPPTQECWDKDLLTTDDFMGSLQFTETDLALFQVGVA